jgi:hypothetical protein
MLGRRPIMSAPLMATRRSGVIQPIVLAVQGWQGKDPGNTWKSTDPGASWQGKDPGNTWKSTDPGASWQGKDPGNTYRSTGPGP